MGRWGSVKVVNVATVPTQGPTGRRVSMYIPQYYKPVRIEKSRNYPGSCFSCLWRFDTHKGDWYVVAEDPVHRDNYQNTWRALNKREIFFNNPNWQQYTIRRDLFFQTQKGTCRAPYRNRQRDGEVKIFEDGAANLFNVMATELNISDLT